MGVISKGYEQFRAAAEQLRRKVRIAAVVSSSRHFLTYGDPSQEDRLAQALQLGVQAQKEALSSDEFTEALTMLRQQVVR